MRKLHLAQIAQVTDASKIQIFDYPFLGFYESALLA
jgi:hypothetical protein